MQQEQQQPIEAEIVHPEPEPPKKKSKALAKREETAITQTGPAPGSIEDLMVRAVEQGNMDVIERVFALGEKVRAERARKAFFDGLSQFQANMPKIPKTKKGYGYWYAPLGTIDEKIRKPMEVAGLSKRWEITQTADEVTVSAIITHAEGHSEATTIGPVGWDLLEKTERMNSLQHRSSTITYLQRYTLIGALGLSTADDDPDGVIPEDARAQKATQQRAPVSQPREKPTAAKKATSQNGKSGDRPQIEPGAEDACIEASTMKVVRSKMEHLTLSLGDFKKRFPAFKDVEDPIVSIKRTDMNVVLGWLADPAGY